MPSLLFRDLQSLVQVRENLNAALRGPELAELPCLNQAFLLVENGKILDFGPMSRCPERADQIISGQNRLLLPSFCDSHTHIVYAQAREQEFVAKIQGMSYEAIAKAGGGILNSAAKLRAMPEETLLEQAWNRLQEIRSLGTGAVEIKSGYGLDLESELKMLRVIRQLKELSPLRIKATFLGAHAYPQAYQHNPQAYVQLIIQEMLPQVADQGLADFCDVFCETGFFSQADTEKILQAALNLGLKTKVHANELDRSGGVQAGVKYQATSVDHLECLEEEELQLLGQAPTLATLLPATAFYLRLPHYAPARALIQHNAAIALASDYNPGTAPSGSMPLVWSLACIQMRMLPEEALNAMTINGAWAMDEGHDLGRIQKGCPANLILTKPVPSLAYLPYAFGSNWIEQVWIQGQT